MKKFVAFNPSSNSNSGMKSRDEAEKWAGKEMANKTNVEAIVLTEVLGEIRRTTPSFEFVPLDIEEEEKTTEPVLKFAQSA